MKRVITKIGDILCAEIDGDFKCYLQFVTVDFTQLNSTVIRVFYKERYWDRGVVVDTIRLCGDKGSVASGMAFNETSMNKKEAGHLLWPRGRAGVLFGVKKVKKVKKVLASLCSASD